MNNYKFDNGVRIHLKRDGYSDMWVRYSFGQWEYLRYTDIYGQAHWSKITMTDAEIERDIALYEVKD